MNNKYDTKMQVN